MPPGNMIIPVKATGKSKPFCRYCGNRNIADKVIPKLIMTNKVPTKNPGFANAFKFKIGCAIFN